jgi:Leucine-rich repeat (LRR) protein
LLTSQSNNPEFVKLEGFKILKSDIMAIQALEAKFKIKLPIITEIEPSSRGIKIGWKRITGLGLFNLEIDETPNEIFKLDKLQELQLRKNRLKNFNSNDLNLMKIDLSENQLSCFKPSNKEIIEILDLSNNKLAKFNAKDYSSLKILNLKDNKLINFDTNNPLLRLLNLQNNQLKNLDTKVLSNKLEIIKISRNLLETFEIDNHQVLRIIDLGNNLLTRVKIKNLPKLEFLNLSSNQLEMNQMILENISPKEFSMTSNGLTSFQLKEDIIYKIEKLYLGGNKLTELDLNGFNKLEELFLEKNQLVTIHNIPSNLMKLMVKNNNNLELEELKSKSTLKVIA